MISESEYKKFRKQIDKLKQEQERARGKRDQLLSELKEEFGCKSLKEAQKLLKKLKKEEAAANAKFEKEYKKFKRLYREQLENLAEDGESVS